MEGPDHGWQAPVMRLAPRGHGCPYCAGKKPSSTNSLALFYSDLIPEWHPTKNGDLTPSDVTAKSHRKVWWYCDKGPDHEWLAVIGNRTLNGAKCACCTNKQISVTNSLETRFPKLSREWHPTKNGNRTPADVIAGTAWKAWWRCSKGHEWPMAVVSRSFGGNGCKRCARTHRRSYMETALAFELFGFFGIGTRSKAPDIDGRIYDTLNYLAELEDRSLAVGSRSREADIIIRELNLIVEYDGNYWHSDATRKNKGARYESDVKKTRSMQAEGWTVIQVREHPLQPISETDIVVPSNQDPKLTANDVLQKIQEIQGFPLAGLEESLNIPTVHNATGIEEFYRRQ